MPLVLIIAVLFTARCASAAAQSPASELAAAVADAEQLGSHDRTTARYLSLYAITPERREEVAAVASYVLNALSRARAIVRPKQIGETLLRFDIAHYTTNDAEVNEWLAAWEKIVEVDPYWHLRTEVKVPSPRFQVPSSKRLVPKPETWNLEPETKVVTIDGGWTGLANAARLKTLTGSDGALLRADHFIPLATVPPRYYEFAGVAAKEAGFLKSLGVDAKKIEQLRANAGANLVISGVTKKPRRVIWQQGPLGGVYATLDVVRVDAERDPLRRPLSADGLEFRYDASEWFALRANGLWLNALYNRAGARQDSVPDVVAKDTSDAEADGIIVPMLSCIRCHRESGLRPFRDDQSSLLADGIELRSLRAKDAQRIAEFYDDPRLQRQMTFDRETYSHAVARATVDMRPEDLADALARTVREFAYIPISPEQAAREIGVAADDLRRAFTSSRDPVLLMLRQGRSVLRGQWESSFAEAAVRAETGP